MFYPEEVSTAYIMTKIANKISADAEVHVICGPIGYDKIIKKSDAEDNPQLIYHRISTFNLNKNNILFRLFRLLFLSFGMFFKGLFLIKRGETAFIVTNPAFIIPYYGIIKKIKKNRLIILVHDVFPENLIPSKVISSTRNIFYRIIKKVFDWGYNQADKLIVLGSDMLEIMRNKTRSDISIEIIENWADVEHIYPLDITENPLVQKYQLQGKIIFNFSGNIGRVQGLEFLFRIITKVNNPLIHFLFIGDGAMRSYLQHYVEQNHITCVTFAGSRPRNEQVYFLNAANFGLVTLDENLYGLGVPSKSYNIMAAGKPILFIGNLNTEIGRMVQTKNCGYAFGCDSELALIEFFNNLSYSDLENAHIMGQKARELAETSYNQYVILERFKHAISYD